MRQQSYNFKIKIHKKKKMMVWQEEMDKNYLLVNLWVKSKVKLKIIS